MGAYCLCADLPALYLVLMGRLAKSALQDMALENVQNGQM
jgi:hypothetical protein